VDKKEQMQQNISNLLGSGLKSAMKGKKKKKAAKKDDKPKVTWNEEDEAENPDIVNLNLG